jgi:hypothetical protein
VTDPVVLNTVEDEAAIETVMDQFFIGQVKDRRSPAALVSAQAQRLVPKVSAATVKALRIPSPSAMPSSVGPAASVEYLARAYSEAVKWTASHPHAEVPGVKAAYHSARALLAKDDHARHIHAALVEARDVQDSRMSPVMWAWWRIDSLIEKFPDSDTFPHVLTVFKPEHITDGRMRSFFWRDGMARAGEVQVLWPLAGVDVLKLWREFERAALESGVHVDELVTIWSTFYLPRYTELTALAAQQGRLINAAVAKAHTKNDLGLWLAHDNVKHLKLTSIATNSLA